MNTAVKGSYRINANVCIILLPLLSFPRSTLQHWCGWWVFSNNPIYGFLQNITC